MFRHLNWIPQLQKANVHLVAKSWDYNDSAHVFQMTPSPVSSVPLWNDGKQQAVHLVETTSHVNLVQQVHAIVGDFSLETLTQAQREDSTLAPLLII